MGRHTRAPRATHTRRAGVPNKLESQYAEHLETLRRAGVISRYDYEPVRLRLADQTYYTPDYRVVAHDGTIEFHEVKGWLREDAWAKLKVAAETHPYKFALVYYKNKQWIAGWKSQNYDTGVYT